MKKYVRVVAAVIVISFLTIPMQTMVTVKSPVIGVSAKAKKKVKVKKWNPKRVVLNANKQVKKFRGSVKKIYIPDEMKRQLAKGLISKKEYKKYYPSAGAGYIQKYYRTDLNQNNKYGKKLNTEAKVVQNIVGVYKALPKRQKYFYIQYKGTKKIKGQWYYVIRCYRA